jgi:hypothetical protein
VLYKNNKLDKKRIDRLEAIGFVWDPIKLQWEEMFLDLVDFKRKNGHCNVPQSYLMKPQLGSWLATQRSKYNKGKLAQERRKRLEDLGVIWDPHTVAWETQFAELEKFKQIHNHCNVPKVYPQNPTLGTWVSKQRKLFNQKKLSTECIEKLEKIGMLWNPRLSKWDKNYQELASFKKQYGHFNILKICPEKTNLDLWMKTQRVVYKSGKLSQERIEKLEAMEFIWDPIDTAFENFFTELCEYKKSNGHCKVPARYSMNRKLASWVSNLRLSFHGKKLSVEKIDRLNAIGFDWDPFETAWQENIIKLSKFKELNGHMNISSTNVETKPLANWASKQREQYKEGILTEEKIIKLEGIGFVWDPITAAWNSNFQRLSEFKEVYGHCNVPQKSKDKVNLASWVHRQRTEYKNGMLSRERIEKLEKIGFCFELKSEK